MRAHKCDVAIYMPFAAGHYRRSGPVGGGAELQTVLLARALKARGMRVAHIVWPIDDPAPRTDAMPTLIERDPYRGSRPVLGGAAEAVSVWRSMAAADAGAYVFRTGRSRLLVGAMFCRVRGRKFVYAGAHDLDFTFDDAGEHRRPPWSYRAALRRSDLIVTQTERQLFLARSALGDGHRVTMIPSFVEPAAATRREPDAFIWIGRLAPYKQPLEYIRLAEAMPGSRFRMVFELQDPGAAEILEDLRDAERRLSNLELLGQIPRERLLRLIEQSFAVVSTSTHEGMPNVFLEAWARGVPVASLICDPGGQLASHEAGLVAGGSRRELVEIAESLARDADLRARLGGNGRRYVMDAHDSTAITDRWAELLADLLGPAPGGG
jgi:glycosyltransferase involved in cell wall biosynthesis